MGRNCGRQLGLVRGQDRQLKYPPGIAVSNYPFWKLQMGSGMALAVLVFAAAWLTLRRRPWTPRLACWIAVGISATTAGILLGVAADKMFYESYGLGGWLGWGSLLAAAIASPVICANALMSGRSLPTFLELIGPRQGKTLSVPTMVLGLVLTVTTLIAAETALGLLFDPRWRDFPFASLTMAVVPFWTLALLNRPKSGTRPIAEAVFACLLGAAALYATFNEGLPQLAGLVDLPQLFSARHDAVAGAKRCRCRNNIDFPVAVSDADPFRQESGPGIRSSRSHAEDQRRCRADRNHRSGRATVTVRIERFVVSEQAVPGP